MMNAPADPRCPGCNNVLVHAGAVCVICDDRAAYEGAVRTAPPLRLVDSPELPEKAWRERRDNAS